MNVRTVVKIDTGGGAFSRTSRDMSDVLKGFAAALTQSEVLGKAKELLPRALQMSDRFNLERAAIADACQVSEATVSRWASGQVRPHVIFAKIAIETISRLAMEKAEEYRREFDDVSRASRGP